MKYFSGLGIELELKDTPNPTSRIVCIDLGGTIERQLNLQQGYRQKFRRGLCKTTVETGNFFQMFLGYKSLFYLSFIQGFRIMMCGFSNRLHIF